jgi:uncharacterized protein YbjQ (UPF0145 family)
MKIKIFIIMKKFLLVCVAAMGLLVSSCGVHQEATSNYNQLQTQVVLDQANYDVVGTATGECTQVYVLGIGGLSKKSMSESAMSEMYKNANIKGSQAIINANVQYKASTVLGIYSKVTAIANGTIIEFKK